MNSAVYNKLVDLCIDICKRNGIKRLLWFPDKTRALSYEPADGEAVLTVHRWFASKSCPGNWLYSRLGSLASKVNASLDNAAPQHHSSKPLYRVQTSTFKNKSDAQTLEAKIKNAGFEACLRRVDGMYEVQVGVYLKKEKANAQAAKLKAAGFDCSVATHHLPDTPSSGVAIKTGSRVKVKPGAKTYTGGSVASFVYKGTYTVDELKGSRAVLDKKGICTPFNVKDLVLA